MYGDSGWLIEVKPYVQNTINPHTSGDNNQTDHLMGSVSFWGPASKSMSLGPFERVSK